VQDPQGSQPSGTNRPCGLTRSLLLSGQPLLHQLAAPLMSGSASHNQILFFTRVWSAAIARGSHPFPSRTRPLSLAARMVLPERSGGRVRRRRLFLKAPRSLLRIWALLFCCSDLCAKTLLETTSDPAKRVAKSNDRKATKPRESCSAASSIEFGSILAIEAGRSAHAFTLRKAGADQHPLFEANETWRTNGGTPMDASTVAQRAAVLCGRVQGSPALP
jgi:hypothetical protein